MAEENKNEAVIPEGSIVLTKEEFTDIKKFMAESAAKDQKIEDLTGLVGELKKMVSEVNPGDSSVSDLEIQAVETGKYVRMRKLDGKWIIGWTEKGSYRERNSLNEIIEFVDVLVLGEEKPHKMPLLSFLNDCPQSIVEVKEKKALPDEVEDLGLIPAMTFNEKTGQHEYTGRKVRNKVVSKSSEFVLLLDGKEVTVHERFINQ